MHVEQYDSEREDEWDNFVRRSKNGTFLFTRKYMDYHRERFEDYSLMIRGDRGQVVALLPANRDGTSLVSHGGLTYGGFVTDAAMKTARMLDVFACSVAFLKGRGFARLEYKTIPHLYHQLPAEEDRYALFLAGADVTRRGLLTVVVARDRPVLQERRMRGARKARQSGLTVVPSTDFAAYWEILTARLLASFGVRPVHALEEIRSLRARFPDNIKLYACLTQEGQMVAGVVIYESALVAHCQYIAASDAGRDLQALDLLFTELVSTHYAQKPYFDFGTSDEDGGRRLNQGLVEQKEGFGARAIVHDHYALDLDRCDSSLFMKVLS